MSKFIDKMNLPQYKYFNNMLSQDEKRKELVADGLSAGYLVTSRNKREYQEGLVLLSKSKAKLADFIYVFEEDKKRCRSEISIANVKVLVKRVEKYLNILSLLPIFQGKSVKRTLYIEDDIIKDLPESQLLRLYKYDEKKEKYYKEIMSIPKLVLINEELYQSYLMREFTDKELKRLDELVPVDVHFIIVVQSETQKDIAYVVGKDKGKFIIDILKREYAVTVDVNMSVLNGRDDLSAMLLSLLDYLIEIKKAESERRKQSRGTEGSYNLKESHPRQYVDKNSIKVYDMKGTAELDAFRFIKKRGRLGVRRRQGYEMIPHTRKGHYRHYKDGKVVYVRSTVIHKEKYEGIQSAHRINEKEEKE